MIENPRVRLALAERGRQIAIALAVLGAVMLVLAIWTVATPATESTQERTDVQSIETEVTHSATVTSSSSPWEQGTVLEDHPAYLLNASPVLDVEIETDAPPGSTVFHDARLQLRVVRDGEVVWERTESLATEEVTATNGTATSTAEIDVEAVQTERQALQSEFAGVGTVQTRIVADVQYETDQYEGSLSATGPLSVTSQAYWIEGTPSDSDPRSQTVTVERTAPIDWGTVVLLVLLGLTAVGGAAAAATYRVEADIDWLQQELHRQRYDDWISDGDLPMGVGTEYVSLNSLKDVVDVAIDTNQRVVYDDRRNVFAVISGEVVYYYSKDGDWNRVAWPGGQSEGEGPSFLEAFGMGDDSDVPEVEGTPPGNGDGPPADAAEGAPPGEGSGEGGEEFEFGGADGAVGPAEFASDEPPEGDEDE
ncbi:hypothetical protein GCM10028857_26740 [Salinarchaeum chitinilyticum]